MEPLTGEMCNATVDRRSTLSPQLLRSVANLPLSERISAWGLTPRYKRSASSKSYPEGRSSSLVTGFDIRRRSAPTRPTSRARSSVSRALVERRPWSKVKRHMRDGIIEAAEVERSRKLKEKFRTWARIVASIFRLFHQYCKPEKTSADSPFYAQMETIDHSTLGMTTQHYIFFDPADYKANIQMRMSQNGQRILSKSPEKRTEEELHHVMIALRGIKVIEELPVRMQKNLAKYSTFETFEPRRVIVRQHRRPDAFYFILYGTVMVAILQDSGYAKTEVELTRGHTFGELAIMNGSTRRSSIITKTQVELLCISEEDYRRIFMVGQTKTLHDPDQHQFLSNLYFFKDWPLNLLNDADPTLVTYAYFRSSSVLVKDSNLSDWIIIVKSGSVTVLKKLLKAQSKLNMRTGRYYERTDKDGYFAFRNNGLAYNRYLKSNNLVTPEPFSLSTENTSHSEGDELRNSSSSDDDMNILIRRMTRMTRPLTCTHPHRKAITPRAIQTSSSAVCRMQSTNVNSLEANNYRPTPILSFADRPKGEAKIKSMKSAFVKAKSIRTFLDDIDAACPPNCKPPSATEVDHTDQHPQFVLIQNLTRGQVFGLAQMVFRNQPRMCVISNGAECVLINKRFYQDNSPPVLLRTLKTKVSPYPSETRLQNDLTVRLDWEKYKTWLSENIANQPRPLSAK